MPRVRYFGLFICSYVDSLELKDIVAISKWRTHLKNLAWKLDPDAEVTTDFDTHLEYFKNQEIHYYIKELEFYDG